MKGANYKVVLDACVLANHGVCDLFLRLAERPRLYTPVWSDRILDETTRTHREKLDWPEELADHWQAEVRRAFPEALIEETPCLEPALTNDPKDRHVLATAIRAGATTIVTFNLRHFPPDALGPWQVQAVHPADYSITLYTIGPDVVAAKLADMARDRNLSTAAWLAKLSLSIPAFCSHVADSLGLNGDPDRSGSQ